MAVPEAQSQDVRANFCKAACSRIRIDLIFASSKTRSDTDTLNGVQVWMETCVATKLHGEGNP